MQNHQYYQRIENAIHYIAENFQSQPSLEDMAKVAHMSPSHFQRVFLSWAGISPKKFVQYISLEHAKQTLRKQGSNLVAADAAGLSSTGRLHDLFVSIEGMTPGEYKQGGAALVIEYDFYNTLFGSALIASTGKGICHIALEEDPKTAFENLQQRFPNGTFTQAENTLHQQVLVFFESLSTPVDQSIEQSRPIPLHLAGTPFQLKVWECLLSIPTGALRTYGDIATDIGQPSASRAVGTAIGANPIAYLIPCHRVIQSTGKIGGYRWGPKRKTAIIGWEGAKTHSKED